MASTDLVRRDAVRQHADQLHAPPFGFALFFCAASPTPCIKGGAAACPQGESAKKPHPSPGCCCRLLLVGIVIAFPQTVTAFLDGEIKIDLDR